ncbi:MAG: ABC-type transport system involved in multi-copper enzyme maturation permease subunit [Planctomycetota bacterium]|jgi:ABC-type transport system involved in multi-copper enzyme maturation permease subunit
MKATLREMRVESGRLLRLRSSWFVLLVLSGISALRTFISLQTVAGERSGLGDPLSSGGAWAPFVDGWRVGLVLGALLLLGHAARSIAADREEGLLRLAVTRSVPRGAIVRGRLALAPLLILALVFFTGLASWATAQTGGDFGPFVEDGYEIFTAEELFREVRRAVFAILPALLATYAFGLMISSFFRSATAALAAALGLFLGFDLFKEILGPSRAWVFANHVPTLSDTSAWSELPNVMRGFSDAGFSDGLYRSALIGPWPALLLFLLLSSIVLSRKTL